MMKMNLLFLFLSPSPVLLCREVPSPKRALMWLRLLCLRLLPSEFERLLTSPQEPPRAAKTGGPSPSFRRYQPVLLPTRPQWQNLRGVESPQRSDLTQLREEGLLLQEKGKQATPGQGLLEEAAKGED